MGGASLGCVLAVPAESADTGPWFARDFREEHGLGAVAVSQRLWAEGCRRFFVARIEEGIELRRALPSAEIGVLDGPLPGDEDNQLGERCVLQAGSSNGEPAGQTSASSR